MRYQEVPHAAVNVLMRWVRQQGHQVVSLHTWPQLTRRPELSVWSAHIEVQGKPAFHARIRRNGYTFAIISEPDTTGCPACDAHRDTARSSHDAVEQAEEPVTPSWHRKHEAALQPQAQWTGSVYGLARPGGSHLPPA